MSDASRKVDALASGATLEWLSGPEKGKRQELAGDQLSVGRGSQADVPLLGEGVSRNHALLVRQGDQWFIRDNGSKNGLQVNGRAVPEAWLESGDVVQIGNVVVRFTAPENPGALSAVADDGSQVADFVTNAGPLPKRAPNKRLLLYGALGGVLVLAAIFSQDKPADEKPAEPAAATSLGTEGTEFAKEPKLEVPATPAEKELKLAETEMASKDWSNSSLREAEQLFRRGQREYQAKSYQRAIDLFRTAVTLSREHKLAQLYLARSIYAAEAEAKLNMQLGVRYYRALQYQRAIFHFSEVISLMQHRAQPKDAKDDEPLIRDAKRYIKQSRDSLQAAGIFP